MFFTSESRRLKSAIEAQDAHLGQTLAELAAAVGLGKAGARAAGLARAYPVPVALAGAGIAGAGIALMMLRPAARGASDRLEEAGSDWLAAAREARDAARDRLLELYEQGRATAEARAAVAAEQAEAVAAAMRQGLGHLGDEAADLALEARRRAWEAMEEGGRIAGRGLDEGRRMAKDHPVAATAAGLAVGAGLVALLLRGRGVLKVLTPLALTAAMAEMALRLRRGGGGAEEVAEDIEETAGDAVRSAGKTVRRASRKAEAAGEKAVRAAAGTAKATSRRAGTAAKTGAGKAAKATRSAAKTAASAAAGAAERAADTAEAALNGTSTH